MQKNMGNWRKDADPMDMLQAFVSALAGYYDEEFSNKDASYDKAIKPHCKSSNNCCQLAENKKRIRTSRTRFIT